MYRLVKEEKVELKGWIPLDSSIQTVLDKIKESLEQREQRVRRRNSVLF